MRQASCAGSQAAQAHLPAAARSVSQSTSCCAARRSYGRRAALLWGTREQSNSFLPRRVRHSLIHSSQSLHTVHTRAGRGPAITEAKGRARPLSHQRVGPRAASSRRMCVAGRCPRGLSPRGAKTRGRPSRGGCGLRRLGLRRPRSFAKVAEAASWRSASRGTVAPAPGPHPPSSRAVKLYTF